MIEFVISIAMAAVVGVVGLAVSAAIGQAILGSIEDACKNKDKGKDEEDSRTIGKNRDTDHNSFLT